jgi:hypothetical protein
VSSSIARLIARLIATKVLPSPGSELVTIISDARSMVDDERPFRLVSSGRLMTRNSSAICARGVSGVR